MRHILLDIEGTTTAISFVYDVLFPYAAKRLPTFIIEQWNDPKVATACQAVLTDATPAERALPEPQAVLAVITRQMAADIKAPGLKALQGLVWREGYESGQVLGHVYDDVPTQFSAWKAAGRQVAIYSSGSVLAQQLLFRHSVAGDLTPFLVGHFDTSSGPKHDAASYLSIAKTWGFAPHDIVFGTDQPAEAAAAAAAGMHAVVLMRPGNQPLPAQLPFDVHSDLKAL